MPPVDSVTRTDEDLAAELRLSVMRLRRRLVAERDPANGLSLPQMTVLGSLARFGDQTVGQLAAREMVRPPSMTRAVNCLETGGFVTRRPHDTDGRQVVVSLTEHGLGTLLADRQRRDAWLARLLAELRPEERDLLRRVAPLLDRLARQDDQSR